ncbi:UbiA prenyltransferase family protein [Candidatus Gottesmanbacteria bacterium]|nr:UbiA prenyltransferase family protein [Candidatus Gottesmanbacteria bacterium]
MPYIRLLRLQDQYIQLGASFAAGFAAGINDPWVLWWAIAATFLSITAFIVNELTDRGDVDRYSWNTIHVREALDMRVVAVLFLLFSFFGLVLAWNIGLLWWALASYIIGVLYSLKPIRLKARFGWDIAAQLAVWWLLPVLAVWWKAAFIPTGWPMLLSTAPLFWSIFYPYVLSDFVADQKGGLRGTHIVLGMRRSLLFGLLLGVVAILLYVVFAVWTLMPWTLILVVIEVYVIGKYLAWLRMPSIASQTSSMQQTVRIVKPATQLLAPLIFFLWWFL